MLLSLTVADKVALVAGAANILVAGATFYLALKTRAMARETQLSARAITDEAEKVGKQANAAEKQIELSRMALDASIQPWLTKADAPLWVSPMQDGGFSVRMVVRNIGRGIALLGSGDDLRIQGRTREGFADRFGHASASALPPGEETDITFVVEGVDRETFLSHDRNYG